MSVKNVHEGDHPHAGPRFPVVLDLAEAATNVSFGTLGPEEWAFLPVKASVGLEVTASASTVVLEYGLWTQ